MTVEKIRESVVLIVKGVGLGTTVDGVSVGGPVRPSLVTALPSLFAPLLAVRRFRRGRRTDGNLVGLRLRRRESPRRGRASLALHHVDGVRRGLRVVHRHLGGAGGGGAGARGGAERHDVHVGHVVALVERVQTLYGGHRRDHVDGYRSVEVDVDVADVQRGGGDLLAVRVDPLVVGQRRGGTRHLLGHRGAPQVRYRGLLDLRAAPLVHHRYHVRLVVPERFRHVARMVGKDDVASSELGGRRHRRPPRVLRQPDHIGAAQRPLVLEEGDVLAPDQAIVARRDVQHVVRWGAGVACPNFQLHITVFAGKHITITSTITKTRRGTTIDQLQQTGLTVQPTCGTTRERVT